MITRAGILTRPSILIGLSPLIGKPLRSTSITPSVYRLSMNLARSLHHIRTAALLVFVLLRMTVLFALRRLALILLVVLKCSGLVTTILTLKSLSLVLLLVKQCISLVDFWCDKARHYPPNIPQELEYPTILLTTITETSEGNC